MVVYALILASQIPVLPKVEPAKTLGERRDHFVDVFRMAIMADEDDNRYDLGFMNGLGEWPSSSIMFPAGSANQVIFATETRAGDRLITCYELVKERPSMMWQIKLVKRARGDIYKPRGTLAKRVLEWDTDYRLPESKNAHLQKTMSRVWPYAHYIFQGGGNGELARYVRRDGKLVSDSENARDFPQAGSHITYLERKFLNSLARD